MKKISSKHSEESLCRTYRQGQDALNILVHQHQGLAKTWAKKYWSHKSGCSFDDILQECNRGILDAAKHWDKERGAFSTCATLYMKKRCLAFLEKYHGHTTLEENVDLTDKPTQGYTLTLGNLQELLPLVNHGVISPFHWKVMQVICSPKGSADSEEIRKELFVSWWLRTKLSTMRAITSAIRKMRKQSQISKLPVAQEIQKRLYGVE